MNQLKEGNIYRCTFCNVPCIVRLSFYMKDTSYCQVIRLYDYVTKHKIYLLEFTGFYCCTQPKKEDLQSVPVDELLGVL